MSSRVGSLRAKTDYPTARSAPLVPYSEAVGKEKKRLLVLFGNQLFGNEHIARAESGATFMAESEAMCRGYAAHRHKIVLILSAMRSKADALRDAGHSVHYTELGHGSGASFAGLLDEHLSSHRYTELAHFETESPRMDRLLEDACANHDLERVSLESPMFVTPREEFQAYRGRYKRLFMADFYKWQRRRMGVLLDEDEQPKGGQWSFDEDNRKKLPKNLEPPKVPKLAWTSHTKALVELVDEQFPEHPGKAESFWLPTTEEQAKQALDAFLEERFEFFGDYEDALSQEYGTIFHSVLSSTLNCGLLTPAHVLERALKFAEDNDVRINSLEGFVRQIIGWREFIRGVWNSLPASHWNKNFWGHQRKLTKHWYEGTTKIPPLDDAIQRAQSTAYNHHIERLMVLGNMMLLCRIDPAEAYAWFMEMYADSADWVMAPNVYGMALFSEGGEFTTKPYICGSNYLRKMSNYGKGPWCDVVDGLYWHFIDDHRDFFSQNPRSKMILGTLDRMSDERRKRIYAAAAEFIERVTTCID